MDPNEDRLGSVEPTKIISDLYWLSEQCELRCLYECAKWTNEIICYLPTEYFLHPEEAATELSLHEARTPESFHRQNVIKYARSLIQNKEYKSAHSKLKETSCNSAADTFLLYFSGYMTSVQSRLEGEANDSERTTEFIDQNLMELRQELEKLKEQSPDKFDCFLNYLLGVVRKDSNDVENACKAFREAVDQDHRCWPAWEGLSSLVDVFYSMKIEKEQHGDTWQCALFIAETMFRLQMYLCAIEAYLSVSNVLGSSPYLMCQIAAAQSELQEHDSSINSFQRVRKMDPYRIEQMNFYSDSLYIRQNVVELANLAKWFFETHKFHWETCCIVANYYSARKAHDLAQDFLKRAVKMCPSNASIWVLLGHEYMETKNHQSAIAAYRHSLQIDPLCYRGWYGLGQLYEILKLPACALYYYQQAHKCRPADSRMLIALGVIFSKLNRRTDAEKCFKKAFQIGDVEGNALTHLAKNYEEQEDLRNAAKAYEAYLSLYSEELVGDLNLIATACQFLALYNLNCDDLDSAYTYAQRCLTFDVSKEEGIRILRLIMNKRNKDSKQELISATKHFTPASQKIQTSTMVTPVDVLRPPGGGDESMIAASSGAKQSEDDEDKLSEDMNTSDGDDDLEISF
ncbi:cell division cycle protein 23 like protein [Ditylenchus destructor]|uniref:Cell division cycle protein 23 like protein n=1 Tax=Ditylenchus destructor TaxID=166010 RepID=A0AAD4N628_9BILA|nr:cell division cycle protein 23 like protein [Ditylenchus destructor]